VYTSALSKVFARHPQLVAFLELEPQTHWIAGESGFRQDPTALAPIAALPQRKLVHGVGFPVGGTTAPDEDHLDAFNDAIVSLDAVWASEHLAFNFVRAANGETFHTGFLLPPLQTSIGVAEAARHIREVSAQLPVAFAVETPVNYLRPRHGELSDGNFIARVAQDADCGILLDLHNVWANELNGRQPVRDFLAEIPNERVWEVHVAGGFERDGYWLDAHSGPVPDAIIDLLRMAVPTLPNLRCVTFEIGAAFVDEIGVDAVVEELRRISSVLDACASANVSRSVRTQRRVPAVESGDETAPAEWEEALGSLVVGRSVDGELAAALVGDPAIAMLRGLVKDFRIGMVVDGLKLTCRLLRILGGDALLTSLLGDYVSGSYPQLFGLREADAFAKNLANRHLDLAFLDDTLAFERAAILAVTTGMSQSVRFAYEPMSAFQTIASGRLPDVSSGDFEVEVTPEMYEGGAVLVPSS
jgi:uncharacterized protein (UPF0276 family)